MVCVFPGARWPLHHHGGVVLQPVQHSTLLGVGLPREQRILAEQPVGGGRATGRPGTPLVLLQREQQLGKPQRASRVGSREARGDPVVVLHPRVAVPLP
jgi:hypothetical protein